MNTTKYSSQDVRETYKKKDAWWTVFLVDPIASRLLLPLANYTKITPNQLTLLAFITGLAAAFHFYQGTYLSLVVGAVLYHISFTLDCMDGKISRLKGTGSIFGAWMDYILDRTRVAICAFALIYGQYQPSGAIIYFYLGALICFLDSTRYMNSLLVYKSLNEMRKKIDQANYTLQIEKKAIPIDEINLKEDFLREVVSRYPSYLKIRTFFLQFRVRLHLMSGIEYQMFIFIIAPIIGFIPEGIIASSVLMILFESAVIYKLWLMTIDFQRQLNKLTKKINSLDPE
ncbi:CDP-alcohol phosphatidyltransferase family protein [Paenibacillus sp. SI8]|uniref:CDP-alcohol phosphatidyltransferase family protein n=1 Tax=unclassified Paenibacillus TaxID=185978 RepID=UPI003466AAEB